MREVRQSFQPYLMASGQSEELSQKVLGGDSAKSNLRRRKEKAALLGNDMGEKIWKKPWIPHQRLISEESKRDTIHALAKCGSRWQWEKDSSLESGHGLRFKKKSKGTEKHRHRTHSSPIGCNLKPYHLTSHTKLEGCCREGGRQRGRGKWWRWRQSPQAIQLRARWLCNASSPLS